MKARKREGAAAHPRRTGFLRGLAEPNPNSDWTPFSPSVGGQVPSVFRTQRGYNADTVFDHGGRQGAESNEPRETSVSLCMKTFFTVGLTGMFALATTGIAMAQ